MTEHNTRHLNSCSIWWHVLYVFEHQDISKSKKQKIKYTTKIWLNMTRSCIHVDLCVCIYTYFFLQNWNDTVQCSVCFTVIYGFWGFLSFSSIPLFLLSDFSRINLHFLDIRSIAFLRNITKGQEVQKAGGNPPWQGTFPVTKLQRSGMLQDIAGPTADGIHRPNLSHNLLSFATVPTFFHLGQRC